MAWLELVYFLPNDRPPQPEKVSALRQLMKEYTAVFRWRDAKPRISGEKTFTHVETDDKDGEPVVHHIDGKFPEEHYYREGTRRLSKSGTEVRLITLTDRELQHIHFIAIDLSSTDMYSWRWRWSPNFWPTQGQR